jgi:hypothetical protein
MKVEEARESLKADPQAFQLVAASLSGGNSDL